MSTRPPPPDALRGAAGSTSMASRVYRNFKPIVIITALMAAGWTLLWGIGAFQDINVDKDQKETKFTTLDIILGVLYMVACAIALFGVIAVVMDRIVWARIYRLLAFLAALLIVGSGFIRTVTHFIFKNDLISECTEIVQGNDLTFRFGIWGPAIHEHLDPQEAAQFCKDGWNHDSFTEIVSLLVEIVLMVCYVGVANIYYKQLLDPSALRAPSSQNRAAPSNSFPEHYNPSYLGYEASYDAPPAYAPPPGAPPPQFGKPPVFKDPSDDELDGQGGYLNHDAPGKGDDPFADFDSDEAARKGRESREALV